MSRIWKHSGRNSISAAIVVAAVSVMGSTAEAVPATNVVAGRSARDGHPQIDVIGGRIQITAKGSAVSLETVGAWSGDSVLDTAVRSSSASGPIVTTARGELTESVEKGADTAEQSWRLDHAPDKPGALTIAVAASGLEFAGVSGTGLLLRHAGVNVDYGNGTWIDANGRASAIPAHYDNGRILLTVPAKLITGSTYPAVLDPQIIVTPIT